jgi:hypothetical protein
MRRILDTQRAWIDGARVVAYRTAMELDMLKHHPDVVRKEAAQRWCTFVTPVIKAAFTQQAFYGGSECLQVFGGHGYVREWGIEQNIRDARVAMIYEGTNEIQAIDLLVRKVLSDEGQEFFIFLSELQSAMSTGTPHAGRVMQRLSVLEAVTRKLAASAARDAALPYWVADDYLRAVAMILMDWAWAQIEDSKAGPDLRWSQPAQAMQRWVMPEFEMRVGIVDRACGSVTH